MAFIIFQLTQKMKRKPLVKGDYFPFGTLDGERRPCEERSWVFFLSVLCINFINALNGDTFCSLDSVLLSMLIVV